MLSPAELVRCSTSNVWRSNRKSSHEPSALPGDCAAMPSRSEALFASFAALLDVLSEEVTAANRRGGSTIVEARIVDGILSRTKRMEHYDRGRHEWLGLPR